MYVKTDKTLKILGNILIGKVWYDLNYSYDKFDFLRTRFEGKREKIKIFNKAVYGRK